MSKVRGGFNVFKRVERVLKVIFFELTTLY